MCLFIFKPCLLKSLIKQQSILVYPNKAKANMLSSLSRLAPDSFWATIFPRTAKIQLEIINNGEFSDIDIY